MKRVENAERLLEQSEKDLKRMQEITNELKAIEKNRVALDKYYTEHYMDDYEKYENQCLGYRVLDQDSIWNVLIGQYEEKKILLKDIIKTI